jgi:hypothetical protein
MLNRRGNSRNFAEADRLPISDRGRSIKNSVSDLAAHVEVGSPHPISGCTTAGE